MFHSSLFLCLYVWSVCMCGTYLHLCVLTCLWALRLTWWIDRPPYWDRSLSVHDSARLSSLFHSRDCLCSLRTFVECWGSELWSSSFWGKCFTELSAQQPVFPLVICAYKRARSDWAWLWVMSPCPPGRPAVRQSDLLFSLFSVRKSSQSISVLPVSLEKRMHTCEHKSEN